MKALLIDTSTKKSLLALLQEEQIIFWEALPHDNQLSKHLFLSLQSLPLKELEYIAVGVGPGSFIGTRVGVAVAKGLSFGLGIPLLAVDSPLCFEPEAEATLPAFLYEKFRSNTFHPEREVHLVY